MHSLRSTISHHKFFSILGSTLGCLSTVFLGSHLNSMVGFRINAHNLGKWLESLILTSLFLDADWTIWIHDNHTICVVFPQKFTLPFSHLTLHNSQFALAGKTLLFGLGIDMIWLVFRDPRLCSRHCVTNLRGFYIEKIQMISLSGSVPL